ncbi:uncharacterized protein LOC123560484 [Mercenaria mercenaria]|uniref:uncharacterized protein LOC123560484 n=1 Tax=Mercenaria mercenaria TaxID=6596 RepID=UPI00234E3F70|nr:uncharacterized protein LOC123560484 [Mercenaria mercenaria]
MKRRPSTHYDEDDGADILAHMGLYPAETCYPDSTLKVENPGAFTSVFANNSQTICNTTWTPDKTVVYIDGCRMDDSIFVCFSYNNPNLNKVIGGTTMEVYSINCAEIPASGVFKTISDGFHVQVNQENSSEYMSLEPDHVITSGIYMDYAGTILVTEAYVSSVYFWVMKSSIRKNRIRPYECWAYAGKNISDTVPKRLIYEKGCTVDGQLVGDFYGYTPHSNSYNTRAIFTVFKFYGYDYVTFECTVRVCPLIDGQHGISFCNSNVCDTRKKREFEVAVGVEDVSVKSSFRVVDQYMYSSSDSAVEWLVVPCLLMALLYRLTRE